MAKYQVTFSCGHTETVQLFGKTKDRERWIKWAEENKLCQDCWQAAKEEQRQQATAAAIEENISYGLPSLTGSEKQVAWAETIRAEMVQKIEQAMENLMKRLTSLADPARAGHLERAESVARDEGFESFADFVDCSKEAADAIMGTTSAHWWIESRNNSVVVMLQDGARGVAKARKDAIPSALDAKAEATVRPESPLTETVAEIRIQEKSVEIVFPEKREDFWEIVKKQLGYTWSGSAWKRALGVTTGTPAERAAEAGNRLLTAGFIVRIFDPAIRQAAIDGRYEQECHRWISRKGDDNSRFMIRWDERDERLYSAARKIKGSTYDSAAKAVMVRSEHFDEVLDFAQMYEFSLTPGAREIVDQARAVRDAALIATPARVEDHRPPTPGEKPRKLKVPENVEIADELKD